jgi:hypothetical protein
MMAVTSTSSPVIAKQRASSEESTNVVAVLSSIRVRSLTAINVTPKLCKSIPQLILRLDPNGGARKWFESRGVVRVSIENRERN